MQDYNIIQQLRMFIINRTNTMFLYNRNDVLVISYFCY